MSNGQNFLVSEFMAGGSLETVLWGTEPLPWETRLQYALDIAAGMAYLHKEGVIHRFVLPHLAAPHHTSPRPTTSLYCMFPHCKSDLKTANVLTDKAKRRCKIADFGLLRSNAVVHVV